MRLTQAEISNLKSSIFLIDKDASIYLFGSRVDDDAKGGDIDIAIYSGKFSLIEKVKVKYNFFNQFGEQRIDLFTFNRMDDPFWNVVKQNAIKL